MVALRRADSRTRRSHTRRAGHSPARDGGRNHSAPVVVGAPVATTVFASVPRPAATSGTTPQLALRARVLQVDTYLHLALSGQLAHRGPTTFPWVLSEPLGYHYLAHSWIAQVGVTSGASLDGVLLRFMPVVIPIVIVFTIAVAALRLTGRAWAGIAAAFLVLTPGMMNFLGVSTTRYPMTPLSPTLGLSAPILVVLVVLLALRWRGDAAPGPAHGARARSRRRGHQGLDDAPAGGGCARGLRRHGALRPGPAETRRRRPRPARGRHACHHPGGLPGAGGGLHRSLADAAAQAWPGSPRWTLGGPRDHVLLGAFGAVSVALLGLVLLLFRPWRIDPTPWCCSAVARRVRRGRCPVRPPRIQPVVLLTQRHPPHGAGRHVRARGVVSALPAGPVDVRGGQRPVAWWLARGSGAARSPRGRTPWAGAALRGRRPDGPRPDLGGGGWAVRNDGPSPP